MRFAVKLTVVSSPPLAAKVVTMKVVITYCVR
jgi:hypothetical protein